MAKEPEHTFDKNDERSKSESQAALISSASVSNLDATEAENVSSAEADVPAAEAGKEQRNDSLITFDASAFDEDEEDEPYQVPEREKILPIKAYCTRFAGTECNRCQIACLTGAITFEEERLVIDHDICTRCGVCMGICDAFSSVRITLSDLFAKVKRIANTGDPVFFTCNDHLFPGFEPHSNVILLPCFASVPPEFWMAVLAHDINAYIYVEPQYCRNCPVAGDTAHKLFTHAITHAQNITGKAFELADELPEKNSLLTKYLTQAGKDNLDRRGMISSIAQEVDDIASGKYRRRNTRTTATFHEQRERMRAEGHISASDTPSLQSIVGGPDYKEQRLWPRRELLLETLTAAPNVADSLPFYFSVTDANLCCNEQRCFHACPTGARQKDSEANTIYIDKRFCITCGACLSACKHDACTYEQSTARALLPKED